MSNLSVFVSDMWTIPVAAEVDALDQPKHNVAAQERPRLHIKESLKLPSKDLPRRA